MPIWKIKAMRVPALILFLAFSAAPAFASTFSFVTPSNSLAAGSAVDAQAKFQVSAGLMYVTLVNVESGITSVGQNISSIFFTVNSGASVLSLSPSDLAASSGTEVSIDSSGTVTGSQTVSSTHWKAGSSSGQSYLNDLSGGQPVDTIIGPPSYATVNSSIAGNAPHNPFVQQQAVFTIRNPGLLATSTISSVSIGFGTAAGNAVRAIPEPGGLALLGIGLIALFIKRSKS